MIHSARERVRVRSLDSVSVNHKLGRTIGLLPSSISKAAVTVSSISLERNRNIVCERKIAVCVMLNVCRPHRSNMLY